MNKVAVGIFLVFVVFLGIVPYIFYRLKVKLFLKKTHLKVISLLDEINTADIKKITAKNVRTKNIILVFL